MSDIEIAKKAKLKDIRDIAKYLNIDEKYLEQYGKYKAKISNKLFEKIKEKDNGKLILVTAISPTPLGEGKTTVSIGLADGMKKIGKKSILALREPSLGPVFGIKGGATGGGNSQVAPMEDINLHFTGDIHAITSANNLLASLIDNHIYFGNGLGFKKVVWKRCMDLNDRQLRKVQCGISGEKNIVPREDGFDITAASEIMSIFCMSRDIEDLKSRLGNIIVGYKENEEPIFARDLNAQGAMAALLKEAINPNLVQTLENTPAIIHGGPFANIAHGCNSIFATKLALKLGDYVITEAGFGSDLGAEKFLNIKCRKLEIKPDVVICVATIKAIKYHGGMNKDSLNEENIDFLKKGLPNLFKHVDNMKNEFGLNVIVAINKYKTDCDSEIEFLKNSLKERNIELSIVECWENGGEGAIDIANKTVSLCECNSKLNYTYNLDDSIEDKIYKVATKIYGAENVEYTEKARESIKQIQKLGFSNLPICVAKTQYSFSDNPKAITVDNKFSIHVQDIILKSGAGFIIVITGKIMTMPGLPRKPAAEEINIDNNGDIVGLF